MDFNFKGKRALVTGAGRGIGREVVKKLAEGGAKVIAVSRTESHLKSLKQECPSIKTIAVDVGNWEATGKALKCLGHVDILVNNAGVIQLAPVGQISQEMFDRLININFKAVVNVSQIVSNEMKKKGTGGVIINMSSVGSRWACPGFCVYQTIRAAIDQLTRVMATELGPHKIRVNSVNPTAVNTEFIGDMDKAHHQQLIEEIPLRRICAMVHGANIFVDGGHATRVI